MQIEENFSWIKKIDRALLEIDSIPLIRTKQPFNWEELSTFFSKKFEVENISISPSEMTWRSFSDLQTGLSENVISLGFIASPLEGEVYLLAAEEDVDKLCSLLFFKNKEEKILCSSSLQEGFYQYLSILTLSFISEFPSFQDLSFKMVDTVKSLNENALCLDIKISINHSNIFMRLAITPSFRTSWEKKFLDSPLTCAKDISKSLEINLSLEGGKTVLSYDAFKKIKVGDFVILDQLSFLPKKGGKLTLTVNSNPLFYVEAQENKIKLTDFAFYQGEDEYMKNKEEMIEENVQITQEEVPTSPIDDIPITITVEVARFKMTLEKLMALQPGNLLDLHVHPEKEITLTVNGQKIGKANLISLGETLGIRISEMG
jgi:flagellar motor switch protein FliN